LWRCSRGMVNEDANRTPSIIDCSKYGTNTDCRAKFQQRHRTRTHGQHATMQGLSHQHCILWYAFWRKYNRSETERTTKACRWQQMFRKHVLVP
jgi:hypothetical protein